MAKKQDKPTNTNVCDDCTHGRWNTKENNLDIEGKPITLRCQLYNNGNIGIIRGTKACDMFNQKQ